MTTLENINFEQLLPHRPPMLMLTAILEQESDSVHCSSVIEAQNPLLSDGLFPVTGGLELLAQAAGTLLGVRAADNAARPGAIVQVKSFQAEPLDIPVGAELHIHARYQAGTAEAALFEGEVMFGEQRFFTGTLMIALLPEDTG
jgi:predicted hotdog family 3-hydroxylacyl-ACP dehydratase